MQLTQKWFRCFFVFLQRGLSKRESLARPADANACQVEDIPDKESRGGRIVKAIIVGKDESNRLSWEEQPTPEWRADQVLVRVHATAINRADLLQRRGMYPPPPGASSILGLEMAGEIVECGSKVTGWSVGDRVCCLLEGGGYAEYCAVDASMLIPLPEGLSFAEGAAIPEVFITAFLNVFIEAGTQPGERVLIHAGASGVGTAAIQLCKAFGNPVVATASSSKLAFLEELGVEAAIDRKASPWRQQCEERGIGLFDTILDPVGAAYLKDNIASLNQCGRLVLIGLLGGPKGEIPLHKILRKRIRLIGSVLRSRSRSEKVAILEQMTQRVWPLFADGTLRPVIHATMPIAQAEQAHDLLASNETIGKIVLSVPTA